ncbi:hypothetical protein O185_03060 [Photorhabdus temperata J3]|uniref:Uncharacterized protein n=1 Tax=Photorhabdus temperata J3 TaxID=1389415 RepID=U7R300_PHOTE|nr:hypothetical protein O185_03060 [Photorhabdus temperata J3]
MMTHCFLFLKIREDAQYAIIPIRNNSVSLVSGAYSAMLMKKWLATGWTEAPTPDGIQYFLERADRSKSGPQYSG